MPRRQSSASTHNPPRPRARKTRKNGAAARASGESRVSHLRRPQSMPVEEWQQRLRRQFGRAQSFGLDNIGDEPVFSEFEVSNPQSGSRYRVAIRGSQPGESFCACPDFATNDLGTCKHIEFVLGALEKKRGGKRALALGFHPPYSEIHLRYGGDRQVRFRAGTQCPPALARRAARLLAGSEAGALPVERFPELEGFLASAEKLGHELRCYDDALAFVAQVRDAAERRRIIDAAYPKGARSAALKGLVKTGLYPYQADGALFAARAGRCLIGDEMGLGKTIQALAATELFARHFGAERVLIVCPTSLKHQWQREIARFTDRQGQVIDGPRATREQQYAQAGFCKIVNYDVLAKDLEQIRHWSPDVVIVDEAQRIKNWNTVAARALKSIESPYAIVLTGTPLENRLEELLSIVQFVDRHRLGPTWRLRHDHQALDESGRVIGYRNLDRIGKTLAPILLRRRKAEVMSQLPPRVDNTVFVPMTDEQMVHHKENGDIVDRIVSRWRKTGFLSDADQRRLTCCLQNMRMSCNSTFLLDRTTDHGAKVDELVTLLEEVFERPDAKVVVFSQWVRTHELIIRRLNERGWGYALFHGGVPSEKRGALVDRFRDDPACRAFLSTDAGGVGLNLQHAASTIINMDMPWNPAVLEQRVGRVYRLGQSRSVQVVNFVAQGTIEERMLTLLAFKKSLFAGVLDGGEREVFLGGTKLSKFMESVDAVAGAGTGAQAGASAEPRAATATGPGTDVRTNAAAGATLPQAMARAAEPALESGRESAGSAPQGAVAGNSNAASVRAASAADDNPWAPLLSVGVELLKALSDASRGNGSSETRGSAQRAADSWIETDAQSGRSYLKVPMPEPQVVQQLSEVLGRLIAGLGRKPE